MTPDSSPPLVVGAGPVGLTMACELARHGVRCRIIDQAPRRSETSKALAIFPRTLEVFESMGIAERVVAAGDRLEGLSLHHRREQIAQIDVTRVLSPFPFVLSLPQSETERLLIEHLASFGLEVERETSLTSLTQAGDLVRAVLRRADGREEVLETPWLIGCDGAHSATRHGLAMDFEGAAYDESFILADVHLESPPARDRVHLFLGDDGILGVIPFGEEWWRIVANVPPKSREESLPDVTLDEVQRLIEQRGPGTMRASDPLWLSRFHISHRIVRDFRQQRVFLAGDAAHIHSPAGGQGMNTGVQDAFNLAWKLALVVRGRAAEQLLDSYHIERAPIARSVINLTDRITRFATMRNSLAQSVRDFLFPVVSGIDFVGHTIADRLAELSVSYRHSPLVETHGPGRPRAGDRAPDAELRNRENHACRLFELFRQPGHVLLVFLGASRHAAEKAGQLDGAITGFPGDAINVCRIVRGESGASVELHDISGLAHAAYGLSDGGVILVRPDGYIAFRSDDFDPAKLRNYLARLLNG